MKKILFAREERFTAIAKVEASPAGYNKYAPITRGPAVTLFALLILGFAVPFYLVWRLLLAIIEQRVKP